VIYFILYLFLETVITIEVGSLLGGGLTFLEIVLTFFLGIFLIQNFKYNVMETLYSLIRQEINQKEMVSITVLSLVGAIFLIIPGIFSDILGLLLQIEFFAIFIADSVIKRSKNVKTTTHASFHFDTRQNPKREEIIDVEVIEEKKDDKK
jgi:2-isopropylmalate synthase/UPF0716 protein FxsA